MQRHLLIAASPSQRRLPPRPSPLPRQQPTPSPAARDGGRGASATANKKIWFVKRETARQNRAVFVVSKIELGVHSQISINGQRLAEVRFLERIADSNQTWRYVSALLRYSISSRGGRPRRKMPIEHHNQTRSARLNRNLVFENLI